MGCILHGKIVSFDGAGESLADRRANNIDLLTFSEEVNLDLHAWRIFPLFRLFISFKVELGHEVAGFNFCRSKVAGFRFGDAGTLFDCLQKPATHDSRHFPRS